MFTFLSAFITILTYQVDHSWWVCLFVGCFTAHQHLGHIGPTLGGDKEYIGRGMAISRLLRQAGLGRGSILPIRCHTGATPREDRMAELYGVQLKASTDQLALKEMIIRRSHHWFLVPHEMWSRLRWLEQCTAINLICLHEAAGTQNELLKDAKRFSTICHLCLLSSQSPINTLSASSHVMTTDEIVAF
jgi:hypothetical protein